VTRWLLAVAALVLALGAGYIAFLNPARVTVHLTPERTVETPLAAALLAAFALGALLVGVASAVRAGARGWRSWRASRHARRVARATDSTARARRLVWAGDWAQARAELARAHGEPDAERLALQAEVLLHEGDPVQARTLLERAVARLGDDPRLLDLLADAAERTGDRGSAAAMLERARIALPSAPRLAHRLRDVHARAGRWSDALAVQTGAMLAVRDPEKLAEEREALCGLRYQAALATSDPRQAARQMLALAREHPEFVPAWVSAGDLLAAAGRSLPARRVWERGARHQPAAVLLERLEAHNVERPERTARVLRRLQRRHPDAPAIRFQHVRHLLTHGALDRANEELSSLPASAASHPLAHALWGELHQRRGNVTLAAETMARALAPETGLVPPYRCSACGRPAASWEARCPACGRWNTLVAPGEQPLAGTAPERAVVTPVSDGGARSLG
jgi:lipopolysaccharide biosynthesis regulator YciM/uncharacterized integral membrane protein